MEDLYHYYSKYPIRTLGQNEYEFSDAGQENYLTNVSKVNLFVGANNSGKSRLLRSLIKDLKNGIAWDELIPAEAQKVLDGFRIRIVEKANEMFVAKVDSFEIIGHGGRVVFSTAKEDTCFQIQRKTFDESIEHTTAQIKQAIERLEGAITDSYIKFTPIGIRAGSNDRQKLIKVTVSLLEECITELHAKFLSMPKNVSRFYIPSFRTLRSFSRNAKLREELVLEYEFNIAKDKPSINIETGEDFARYIKENKNSKAVNRNKVKQFEAFLGSNFFNNQTIEITTHHDNDKYVHIKVGDEAEQPIHNLGDGLQMIIIMTLPYFLHEQGLVIIEEPELYVHPGLQRKLLDFFTNHPKTKNFQTFIATHSNHFIDSAINSDKISVYIVKKQETKNGISSDGVIENLPKFAVINATKGRPVSATIPIAGSSRMSVPVASIR